MALLSQGESNRRAPIPSEDLRDLLRLLQGALAARRVDAHGHVRRARRHTLAVVVDLDIMLCGDMVYFSDAGS